LLTREDYPNYYDLLSVTFFEGEQKPARHSRNMTACPAFMSAVEAGSGVAVAVDFGYSFGNRIKFLHLILSRSHFRSASSREKENLAPAAETFWQCAKEAASSAPRPKALGNGGSELSLQFSTF